MTCNSKKQYKKSNKNADPQSPQQPQSVKVRGDKHLMFTKIVPQYDVEVLAVKSATMYLSTMMENKINLAELLNEISDFTPDDRIKIVINSPGGLVSEGKSLINTLLGTGSKITTELLSDAASMAAILFCVGHKRVAYENSGIMFHTFSSGYVGKGGEMKDYIMHKTKNLEAFFRSHIIGLTDEEIDKMIDGKEWWFGTKKMCERGIATHVNVHGVLIPADRYLKLLKKVKKTAKKMGYGKISSLTEALIFNIDALSPIIEEKEKLQEDIQNRLTGLMTEFENEFTNS